MSEENKKVEAMMKPKLTPTFKLMAASWHLYVRGFINFIGMYLWGLLGLLPLFVLVLLAWLVFLVAGWQSFGLYCLFGALGLLALAWAIYYGTRAKVGLLLLIRDDFKSVNGAFKESRIFFWRYLWASLLITLITVVLLFCLVVPGIAVMIFYAFALFAVVFENKRTFSSVERSYDLVKGYWWPVFGRILFLTVLAVLISIIFNLPMPHLSGWQLNSYSAVINLIWMLISPFFLVYAYYIYKDLVAKK